MRTLDQRIETLERDMEFFLGLLRAFTYASSGKPEAFDEVIKGLHDKINEWDDHS